MRSAGAAARRCSGRAASTPDRLSICAGTLEPPTGLHTVEAWWVSEASDYHERPDLPERDTE